MNTSVGQRIKSLLYEYRFKQVDVLNQLNWDVEEKKSTLSFWLRQKEDTPYLEFLAVVLDLFPQINPHWIITGKGEKLISTQVNTSDTKGKLLISGEQNQVYRNDRQLNRLIDMLEKQIEEKDKTINRLLSLLEENNKKQ